MQGFTNLSLLNFFEGLSRSAIGQVDFIIDNVVVVYLKSERDKNFSQPSQCPNSGHLL